MSRTSRLNELTIITACKTLINEKIERQPADFSDLKNKVVRHIEEAIRIGNTFADDLDTLFQAESDHRAAKKDAKKAAAIALLYISLGPLSAAGSAVVSTVESILKVACQSAAEAMLISYDYGRDVHGNNDEVRFHRDDRHGIKHHFFDEIITAVNEKRIAMVKQFADESYILDVIRGPATQAHDAKVQKVRDELEADRTTEAKFEPGHDDVTSGSDTFHSLEAETKLILSKKINDTESALLSELVTALNVGGALNKTEMSILKSRIIAYAFKSDPSTSVIQKPDASGLRTMQINPAAFEDGWLREGSHRFTGVFLQRQLKEMACVSLNSFHDIDRLIKEMPAGLSEGYRRDYNLYAMSKYKYKRKNALLALVCIGELMQNRSSSSLTEKESTHIVSTLLNIAVSTPEFNKHKINPLIWILRNTALGKTLISKVEPKNLDRMITHAINLSRGLEALSKVPGQSDVPSLLFGEVIRSAVKAAKSPVAAEARLTDYPVARKLSGSR